MDDWWHFFTDPMPVPCYLFILAVLAGFCVGALVMWSLGDMDRRIARNLKDAKDQGEIDDVKDQADGK